MRAVRNWTRVGVYGLVVAVVGFYCQAASPSDNIVGFWLAVGLVGWSSFVVSQLGFCAVGLISRKVAPWLGWTTISVAVLTAYCFIRITCFAVFVTWFGPWEVMAAGLPFLLVMELILCTLCVRTVRLHQGIPTHSLSA